MTWENRELKTGKLSERIEFIRQLPRIPSRSCVHLSTPVKARAGHISIISAGI